MSKRYFVQMAFLEDTLTLTNPKWYTVGRGFRTLPKARKNWWKRVSSNNERLIYRLFDTEAGKVVE